MVMMMRMLQYNLYCYLGKRLISRFLLMYAPKAYQTYQQVPLELFLFFAYNLDVCSTDFKILDVGGANMDW